MSTPLIELADLVNDALETAGYSSQRTYLPLVTPSSESITIVVQPYSTALELTERGLQSRNLVISITVCQTHDYGDATVADELIEELHDIENVFANQALGDYECMSTQTSNPLLSETMLSNEKALTANLLLTFKTVEVIGD